ncbi:protealysin inhibitor emfourin [Streptomyces sp. NRRL B-24484]|uniref:protealysin inhibitor emfourin n=1 Tax=Streptomyces sp. NRRL B-24484 TaxID=1463833 RepID=UPI0004BE61B0|nr:protealysin inhibitor emfourin [Streptomyces sp. NRRL B-24484]
MKVTLAEHGGLAAAVDQGHRPRALDSDALPENTATELARLVAEAAVMPQESGTGRARDAMSYTITVEEGGRLTVLTQSDAAMSPAFATLLTWLEKHFAQ